MNFSRFRSFLFDKAKNMDAYGFVVTRLVIAALWLNAVMPRLFALAAGKPVAQFLVTTIFGAGLSVPLTYFFTVLEILGSFSLIFGFAVRLASVWGVVEFVITSAYGVMTGSLSLTKDLGLLAGSFRLLISGSSLLSLDGYLAKREAGSKS